MLKIAPFFLFDGNCAEAMAFYQRCFGGELSLTRLGDTPMKEMFELEKYNRIINARLENGEVDISAADWMASPQFNPVRGNMSAVYVTGKSYDEMKGVFDKLAEGAERKRFQELHDMPFGVYGQFYDKYGVQWIFVVRKE